MSAWTACPQKPCNLRTRVSRSRFTPEDYTFPGNSLLSLGGLGLIAHEDMFIALNTAWVVRLFGGLSPRCVLLRSLFEQWIRTTQGVPSAALIAKNGAKFSSIRV